MKSGLFARFRCPPPQYLFLLLGLAFGLVMVFVTPPFEVNDEIDHFFRAYQVSELHLLPKVNEAHAISTGDELPEIYLDFWRNFVYRDFPIDPENKLTLARFRELMGAPLNPEKRTFIGFAQARYPFPIYVPQALGIAVGRAAGLPALALLYTGRVANLLCWAGVMFLALRLLPMGQWLFLLLALTPMSVRQGASVCGDAMTNALAFLFLAVLLRCAFGGEAPLTKGQRAALCATAALVLVSKQAYFLLPGLFFLIPVHRFGDGRAYVKMCAIYGAVCAAAFALTVLQTSHTYVDPPGCSVSGQMAHILHHPLHFAKTLILAMGHRFVYKPIILETFIGFQSWRDMHVLLPGWILLGYWIVLVLAAVVRSGAAPAPHLIQRLLLGAIGSASVVLIFTLVYLHYIPVGGTYITTVWGRMLIPIVPVLLLTVSGLVPLSERCTTRLAGLCGAFAAVTLATGVYTLLSAFYVPESNLIANGGFDTWTVPAVPDGWSPAAAEPWAIQREDDAERGPGVRQTWQQTDRELPPERRFGITLTHLKPYSHYRSFCRARCPNRNRFHVEAWSPLDDAQPDGPYQCIERYVGTVPAASPHAHFRSFSGAFFTGPSAIVRLVTVASGPEGEYPASVTWDDWTLTQLRLGMPWRRLFLWLVFRHG